MLLGCIGDDFTGSSDLGNTLARAGMRVVQYTGVPDAPALPSVEAGVIALKIRSVPAADAVAQALKALDWLRAQGCRQFFWKYCSTFDSTAEGNIGPVAEALSHALGLDGKPVVFCPAFPGTGRTICMGHLFVGDRLLNESGMEAHPLTPMTDPDLRRVLAAQCNTGVGHVTGATVRNGAAAISRALATEAGAGRPFIIVDALDDGDLTTIGAALKDAPLVTGGSGIALGLPANFGCRPGNPRWMGQDGPCVALSGSCSQMTRSQVAQHAASGAPTYEIDADAVITGHTDPADLAIQLLAQAQSGEVPLAYSSADPDKVAEIQNRYGRDEAASALEAFFGALALALVQGGVSRLISAGGETSGAIIEAINPPSLEIGPEIAPGVPALRATPDLVVALKSGNFGRETFFADAAGVLEGSA